MIVFRVMLSHLFRENSKHPPILQVSGRLLCLGLRVAGVRFLKGMKDSLDELRLFPSGNKLLLKTWIAILFVLTFVLLGKDMTGIIPTTEKKCLTARFPDFLPLISRDIFCKKYKDFII